MWRDGALMGVFNENRKCYLIPASNSVKLHVIVLLHWLVVLANGASMIILPIVFLTGGLPFYIVFPLMTWLFVSGFTRVDCPFTKYENKLRKKLGKPVIDGFIKHYFYAPYKRRKLRNKRKHKS
jgi:hypothetical protein